MPSCCSLVLSIYPVLHTIYLVLMPRCKHCYWSISSIIRSMIGTMPFDARYLLSHPAPDLSHMHRHTPRTWRMRGWSRRWTSCWRTTSRCGRSARKVWMRGRGGGGGLYTCICISEMWSCVMYTCNRYIHMYMYTRVVVLFFDTYTCTCILEL